jgi:hypothetical protein
MNDKNENPHIQISESTLRAIKDAQESYKRIAENIARIIPKLPKFDFPKFELPKLYEPDNFEISAIVNPVVVREQNAWERHKEILDVKNALLGVQSELLQEQKGNTKLTQWVFTLTIVGTLVALISLIISILK